MVYKQGIYIRVQYEMYDFGKHNDQWFSSSKL